MRLVILSGNMQKVEIAKKVSGHFPSRGFPVVIECIVKNGEHLLANVISGGILFCEKIQLDPR